jgi:hypothetical protein
MGSDLIIGLRISLLGLAITFLAMGLVIVVMILLLRLFPARRVAEKAAAELAPVKPEAADEQALEEMAVALAVGICLLEQDGAFNSGAAPVYRDPSLGKLLEE